MEKQKESQEAGDNNVMALPSIFKKFEDFERARERIKDLVKRDMENQMPQLKKQEQDLLNKKVSKDQRPDGRKTADYLTLNLQEIKVNANRVLRDKTD